MSRVSVRMFAMVLTVLAGTLACQAGSGASGAVPAPAVDEAKATVAGKRTAVVRVDVHDRGAEDLYVATATLTFSVRPTGPPAGAP